MFQVSGTELVHNNLLLLCWGYIYYQESLMWSWGYSLRLLKTPNNTIFLQENSAIEVQD